MPGPGVEPHGAPTRLTGEMQVPNADHRAHDPLLMAGLLDRSTGDPERGRAEALLASCPECAALHRDLESLREATRALPAPRRTRDFMITAQDAGRLRRTGWRRVVAVFGSTRDAFSRPLAIGLTTIGLAGLLVATVPGALPGATSTASLPTLGQAAGDAGAGANPESFGGSKEAPGASAAPSSPGPAAAALTAPSPAPSVAPAPIAPSGAPEASGESLDTYVGAPAASQGAAAIAAAPSASTGRQGADRTAVTSIVQPASVDGIATALVAGLLLAAGIGLFVLRWAGRRV